MLISFLLITCGRKNLLEVIQTDFKDEISTTTNLKFKFNKPIAENITLNRWDTTQYLKFTPHIQGKFMWTSATDLVFSPEKNLLPSTDYQATTQKALLKLNPDNNKKNNDLSLNTDKKISFHTTYLSPETMNLFWANNDNKTKTLRVRLNFNYKINPENAQSLIIARIDNKVLNNVKLLTNIADNTLDIAIEQPANENWEGKSLFMDIKQGLKCAESNFISKKILTKSNEIPIFKTLDFQEAIAEYQDDKPIIRVITNQTLAGTPNDWGDLISLSPKVPYTLKKSENGFVIEGRFQQNASYNLTISSKIKGIFATETNDWTKTLSFGKMESKIKFLNEKAVYLSKKGNKNIGISINNIASVNVKIYKVYENNLLYFLKENNVNAYSDSEFYRLEEFADVIIDRRYETKTLPIVNDFRVLNLDLDEMSDVKGVYVVKVESVDNLYLSDKKMVAISDIGFIAKETNEDIIVFANSLADTKALKGTKISLIGRSNQAIERMETDENGVAFFKGVKKRFPETDIKLLTAMNGKDFNYLYFHQTRINPSYDEVNGYKAQGNYQAFLYSERNLYRPNETMNFNTVVRNQKWESEGKMPIIFELDLPNGRVFSKQKGELSPQGSFPISIKLPNNAMTGTYQAKIYNANQVLLSSIPISVEEFMPDRIKVKVRRVEKDYKTSKKDNENIGDSVRIEAQALHLFGPPAADRNYQMYFALGKREFTSKKYEEYDFGLGSKKYQNTSPANKNVEGQTNEEGKVLKSFYIPKEYQNIGKLQGSIFLTVFDETGRSVSRNANFEVFTQKAFIGVKNIPAYTSTNEPLVFNFLALAPDETPTNAEAKVEIVRNRWQTILEKNYQNKLEYVSRNKEEIVQEANINIAQMSSFSFVPLQAGSYEMRIRVKDSDCYVKKEFYVYKNGFSESTAFQINKDGKIDIKLDKEKYNLGENAKILFTTPFNGKMLVTLERENVQQYFYLDVKNKAASYDLPLKDLHLPNVYITATLLKPISEGDVPLMVAHGFKSIQVENPNSKLTLNIESVDKSESKTQQNIKVKTNRAESDIEVTLAVVDEGILQINNYKTPDIHSFFYQKRALLVDMYDLYPKIFPEISIGNLATGGDDVAGGTRGNPMVNKRVKLVSVWSGILKTNAQGEANYTLNIPQFSGSLRVMAVAYKDGKFGSAEKNIIVADPIVISTGLPRFLSPNDQLTVPVMIMNTTQNDVSASIQIETSDNLVIKGEVLQTQNIKSNQEIMPKYEIMAKNVIDSAKVKITVRTLGRVFSEELFVNIRPTAGLVKTAGSGVLEENARQEFNFQGDLFANTTQTKMSIGRSPLMQFAENLDYLIEYPHGCLEQIISGAFPQLYVQDLMKATRPNLQNGQIYEAEIRENIQEALGKIQNLQLYSGGFAYWSGQYEPQVFASIYATQFMVEAKKAGFAVNEYVLEQALNFLQNEVKYFSVRKGVKYQFAVSQTPNSPLTSGVFIPKHIPYALYVLTLAQKSENDMMNSLKENSKYLAIDSRYLLAASYLLIGEQNAYRELLPTAFEGQFVERAMGGSFESAIRDEALALNALIEADATNPQIPIISQHLIEQLAKNKGNLNTQENAMALLALGKLVKNNQGADIEATLTSTKIGTKNSQNGNLSLNNFFGEKINLTAKGKGKLYYSWSMQGMSANTNNKIKEVDKFLKVRRTFYDQEGNLIRDNTFKQNDLIVVKISISTDSFLGGMQNLVITDMLPAGLEIENPRLTINKSIPWIRNRSQFDYLDVRDDRICYYLDLNKQTKYFYYLARAVSVGTFQLGTISADAMYNPNYYSYFGAGQIKILDKKDKNN